MKQWFKREILASLLGVCLLFGIQTPILAATQDVQMPDVKIEIISPQKVETIPIYSGDVMVKVTNQSQKTIDSLDCFLSVVDQDRKQSFPMDEFGADSYQTREVTSLNPGESCEIVFPIRVMYVGNFRMVVNAVNYTSNEVYTSNALTVIMTSNSNLNRTLVMVVACIVPVILFVITYVLMRKRGQRKK